MRTWQQLVTAPTEAEALASLLDAAEREHLGGGLAVLPQGQVPWKSGAKACTN
jgi:hypothetical protein